MYQNVVINMSIYRKVYDTSLKYKAKDVRKIILVFYYIFVSAFLSYAITEDSDIYNYIVSVSFMSLFIHIYSTLIVTLYLATNQEKDKQILLIHLLENPSNWNLYFEKLNFDLAERELFHREVNTRLVIKTMHEDYSLC